MRQEVLPPEVRLGRPALPEVPLLEGLPPEVLSPEVLSPEGLPPEVPPLLAER